MKYHPLPGIHRTNYSTKGYKEESKDKDNPYNVIPSGNITMHGVYCPVLGTDNLGNSKLMLPGKNYKFPGDIVTEIKKTK